MATLISFLAHVFVGIVLGAATGALAFAFAGALSIGLYAAPGFALVGGMVGALAGIAWEFDRRGVEWS